MIDKRLYPANSRVAHESLRGLPLKVPLVSGVRKSISAIVANLSVSEPTLFSHSSGDFYVEGEPRRYSTTDRQSLLGEVVTVLDERPQYAFCLRDDGYVGYFPSGCISLDGVDPVNHSVSTLSTHAYEEDHMKSPMRFHLPFGAKVQVLDERRKFFETNHGFIPKSHLRPLDRPFEDPATIAQLHYNVPYLWGGNSTMGIDCSGLISASLTACGISCPGDSDMQMALGADVTGDLQRGDLIFWKGHVAMMVDEETLIHANAHHMACRYEPFEQARLRIEAQGDGQITARRRLG